MHKIGSKVWTGGNEITITTEPYTVHGGEYQDGVTDSGVILSVVTPEAKAGQVKEKQDTWQRQQDGFRRLRETTAK